MPSTGVLTINIGVNVIGIEEAIEKIRTWADDRRDPYVDIEVGECTRGTIDVVVRVKEAGE